MRVEMQFASLEAVQTREGRPAVYVLPGYFAVDDAVIEARLARLVALGRIDPSSLARKGVDAPTLEPELAAATDGFEFGRWSRDDANTVQEGDQWQLGLQHVLSVREGEYLAPGGALVGGVALILERDIGGREKAAREAWGLLSTWLPGRLLEEVDDSLIAQCEQPSLRFELAVPERGQSLAPGGYVAREKPDGSIVFEKGPKSQVQEIDDAALEDEASNVLRQPFVSFGRVGDDFVGVALVLLGTAALADGEAPFERMFTGLTGSQEGSWRLRGSAVPR
jgi:hypothetical protein